MTSAPPPPGGERRSSAAPEAVGGALAGPLTDVVAMPVESTLSSLEAPVAKKRAKRWLALDAFRFSAVCLMVQGHVFSTLLDGPTKAQSWYPHHSFLHGYTAPMFLFGAGLAFGYTTFRGWDEHTRGGPAAWKRYRRYGWLLAIGYGLHLPTLALSGLFAIDDPARIARMLQVDVLQHIGASLAICQLLVLVVRSRRAYVWTIAALAALAMAAAPWVWGVDLRDGLIPVWLAGYVNASAGSIFPLVPWAGFTLSGIVVAYAVGVGDARRVADVSKKAAWPFTALALTFMIVPIVLDRFGPYPWPPHNFWKVNPLFFLWRLGNVMAVLAVLCFAERAATRLGLLEEVPSTPLARLAHGLVPWIKIIAAESLIIYVAHLVLLHGSVLGPGLKHSGMAPERSLGIVGATVVTALVFFAMVALAKVWTELKKQPAAFRIVQVAMLGILAYLMLTG